jgi:TolA-binding protein
MPRPLEAEAMVRLVKAQLALGERVEARATISKILGKYPGTPNAIQARELESSEEKNKSE